MKNSLRKGLIAAISAVFFLVIAIVIASNVNFAKAETIAIPDDANAPRVTGEWTDDFYVKDGASVRLETEGIKFTTVVTKAYMQELTSGGATVEFFATAKRVGGTAKAVAYKSQPDVATMGETYNLNTYLNFANVADEDMATACATDFVIETYAKITNGNDVSYVRAYKPENNDIVRSMQAVANAHYLASGDANLKAYFTEGNRSSDVTGFVTLEDGANNGSGKLTMPVAEINGASADVYIGSKKYVGSVNNGEISISGYDLVNPATGEALVSKGTVDASIFVGNTVYSTKLIAADLAVTNANVAKLLETTSGYIAIAEDIDMSTAYDDNGGVWTSTVDFAGEINGFNHTISNLNTDSGLWGKTSAWINDLAIADATVSGARGVLGSSYDQSAHTLKIDNLVVTYKTANNVWLAGGLYSQIQLSSAKASITNSFIYTPATSNAGCGLVAMCVNSGGLNIDGSYFVGWSKMLNHTHYSTWIPNYTGTYTTMADGAELLQAYANGTIKGSKLMLDTIKETLEKQYVLIDSSNVADLLSMTSGTVYIVEDIDMATAYDDNSGVWTATNNFLGTIDGLGHTIKNFKTTTGLFKQFAGTFKNLAFVDTTISGQGGTIAYGASGNVTVSDVYVDADGTISYGAGGLFRGSNTGKTVTLTNVIIDLSTSTGGHVGYYASLDQNTTQIFTNCYFAGGGKMVYVASRGDVGNTPATTGFTIYDTNADLLNAYIDGEVTGIAEFMKNAFEADNNTVVVDSSNVAKLLNVNIDGTIVITEDIDMATAYTDNGGVWTSTADFRGTIYGNGHVISNLKTNTGLFKNYYGGTLKDLALTNVTLTGGNAILGNYTDRNQGRAYNVDNVYVYVKSAPGNVGLIGTANLLDVFNMSNSMLVSEVASCGIFTKVASKKLTLTNCYLINTVAYLDSHYNDGSRTPEEVAALILAEGNTDKFYESVEAMQLDGYVEGTLSEFIEGVAGLSTTAISNYSIVIPEGKSATYTQEYKAAEVVKSFF